MKKIKFFSAWMLLTIFPYLVTITDGLPGIVKIGKVGNYGAPKLHFNRVKLDFYDLVEF